MDVNTPVPKKKQSLVMTGVAMLLLGLVAAALLGSINDRIALVLSDVARLVAIAGIVVIIIGALRSRRKT